VIKTLEPMRESNRCLTFAKKTRLGRTNFFPSRVLVYRLRAKFKDVTEDEYVARQLVVNPKRTCEQEVGFYFVIKTIGARKNYSLDR